MSWKDYDNHEQADEDAPARGRQRRKRVTQEVLDWAYANSTNYAQFIREYAAYVPGQC